MAPKDQNMSAAEFRKRYVKKPTEKRVLTAKEWQEQMKKKKKQGPDHAGDIRIMLQLARIEFEEEYRFHPTRKWRFDFAIVGKKIAIEYEGIFSKKSRHTTVTGYAADIEKYNEATLLGWRVLRYTAKDFKNVIEDLNKFK